MRKYFISILFVTLMIASFALVVAPADVASIRSENREPKKMPDISFSSIWSGEFSKGFEGYIDDSIAFRSKLMALSDEISSRVGYTPENLGRIIITTSDIGTGESNEGRLVLYGDYIMEMFSKNDGTQIKYAESLNTIRAAIPKDINMYSILVPTALEFSDSAYKSEQDSQKAAIELVNSKLKGITSVDIYSSLLESKSNSLYFKTDHHWTTDGAYVAYKKFMEESNGPVVVQNAFTRKENGEFYGSLYDKAKAQLTEQEKDTIFYYDVTEKYDISLKMRAEDNVTEYGLSSPVFDTTKNNYNVFFGSDHPIMEITNNSNPEGKTVMVIKDSYANAFLPWLAASYNKVVVIDPRSFGGSLVEEIERYEADEVLVINYIFSTTFSDYCDMIKNII